MDNSIYSVDNENFQYLSTLEVINEDTANLALIHYDLQLIICFISFFVLAIVLRYTYKFFNIFF